MFATRTGATTTMNLEESKKAHAPYATPTKSVYVTQTEQESVYEQAPPTNSNQQEVTQSAQFYQIEEDWQTTHKNDFSVSGRLLKEDSNRDQTVDLSQSIALVNESRVESQTGHMVSAVQPSTGHMTQTALKSHQWRPDSVYNREVP